MPTCKQCGEVYGILDMVEDRLCKYCNNPKLIEEEKQAKESIEREKENFREKEKEFRAQKTSILASTIATSETTIDNIEQRIDFITVQYVEGVDIIKDWFISARDMFGGRIKSIEDILDEAQTTLLNKLKEKAFMMGGNAVIGIKVEHTYNHGGGGTIVSVIASGTIVKLKEDALG